MRNHPEVKAVLQSADEIYFSPIILGELLAGFNQGDPSRKNREELHVFLSSSRARVISLDDETAERYAVILNGLWKRGTPIPTNDIWIAASAMQYGLDLLTTDAHYRKIPQIIVEYFEP